MFMNAHFGKQLKMECCKMFLFLLLMIIDVSTNAQEVTCEMEQLNSVEILMGHPGITPPYKPGHILVFRCTDVNLKMHGQQTIECLLNGKWNYPYPKCEEVTCLLNTKENNIKMELFPDFECPVKPGYNVKFSCNGQGLILKGQREITCQSNGEWSSSFPKCEGEVHCEIPPNVDNAVITSKSEKLYVDGSNVTYICQSPFKMSGQNTVFCRNGTWEETPTCEAKCHKPQRNFMQLVNEKDVYDNKEILKYRCTEPYKIIPEGQWICENGKWSGDFVCTSQTCPPPPYIENGDYYKYYPNEEVATLVYYRCQIHYVLNKPRPYYKCENGKWDSPPKCLKPCEITSEILEAHNRQSIPEKVYVTHGGTHYSNCKSGWTVGGRIGSFIGCSDGTINIETCQKKTLG